MDGAVDARRVALLERWLDAGHELGNPGYAHLDLHRVDPAAWQADVLRPGGITWLHRWALTAGLDPEKLRGEPEVPGWVREAAGR